MTALLGTLLAAASLLAACARGPERGAPAGTILALGDSLTAGYGLRPAEAWPALLEGRLRESGPAWRVVNAGISGETSGETLARVDRLLREVRPDLVVLAIGINDGFQGHPPARVRANILATVGRIRAAGAAVVLAGMKLPAGLGAAYTREFDAIYPGIAAEAGVPLIPSLLEGVADNPKLNLEDGIHPNAAGERVILATVEPHVRAAIATLPPRR